MHSSAASTRAPHLAHAANAKGRADACPTLGTAGGAAAWALLLASLQGTGERGKSGWKSRRGVREAWRWPGRRRRTPSVPLQRAAGATAGAAWGLPALLYEFQKM